MEPVPPPMERVRQSGERVFVPPDIHPPRRRKFPDRRMDRRPRIPCPRTVGPEAPICLKGKLSDVVMPVRAAFTISHTDLPR